MSILDSKQQVLNVELTKHGRKLLGSGIFQPAYFSFFDESIIYDANYAGITNEPINSIQDRILYNSLGFSAFNLLNDTLMYPLGTSDIFNDYIPAWELNVLKGKISHDQESSNFYKKIFNQSIEYKVSLDKHSKEPLIEEDYILIDLKEINVSDDMKNFEIELVTFDEINGNNLERKLYFSHKKTNIIDGIIYEEGELPSKYFDVKIDINDSEYYLDVLVDDEIDSDLILTKEKELKEIIKGTYTSDYAGPVDPKC